MVLRLNNRAAKPDGAFNLLAMGAINACFMGVVFAFLLFGNLMGGAYAGGSEISTLPVSAYVLFAAVSIIPISSLMARKGRRLGFAVGAAAGIIAGILILVSTVYSSYYLLICAGVFVGILSGSSVFLRFAAIEICAPEKQGRAASIVLSGGIAAAMFASYLPSTVGSLFGLPVFQGAGFATLALGVIALACCTIARFKTQGGPRDPDVEPANLLSGIGPLMAHASFLRAALLSALGYAVMVLIMNSTPHFLTVICRYPLPTAEAVMSYHYLAMFVPFLVSGLLLDRLGCSATILLGIAAYIGAIGFLFAPYSESNAALALTALGFGWNLIFIGATTALVNSVPKHLAHASQTASEFATDVLNVLAAVAAGYFIQQFNFTLTLALALVLVTLSLAVWAIPTRTYVVKDAVP